MRLTSDRPYRPRLSSEAATEILLDRRSDMYDPMVVDAFIRLQPVLVSQTESGPAHTARSTTRPILPFG